MPIQKRVEVGYWASQVEHGALERGIETMQLHRSIGKLSGPRKHIRYRRGGIFDDVESVF